MNHQTSGQYARVAESDPEWVADLFDTLRDGDVDAAVTGMESLLGSLRRAAKARRILATLEPSLLGDGLQVSVKRRDGKL